MDSIWDNKSKILEGIKNTIAKNKFVEEVAKERHLICQACSNISTDCPPLVKECCAECGCSIKFKTHSLASSCPINKWPAIETNVNK